jgi:hypothetical protein
MSQVDKRMTQYVMKLLDLPWDEARASRRNTGAPMARR